MKKMVLSIIAVICISLMVISATYAYLIITIGGNQGTVVATSNEFSIIFTEGQELTGTLNPTSRYDNTFYTTGSIRASSGSAKAKVDVYLNIEEISSALTDGVLKWYVKAEKNGNAVTIDPSSGDFTTCTYNGSTRPCQAGDKLYIARDYLIDYVDTIFIVYIWLDGSEATSAVADAVLNASLGAEISRNFTATLVPPEYREVSYIHFTGTQLVDTGIAPGDYNGNYMIEIQEMHPQPTGNIYLIGSGASNSAAGARANIRIQAGGVNCNTYVNKSDNSSYLALDYNNKLVNDGLNKIVFNVSQSTPRRQLTINNSSTSNTTSFYSSGTTTWKIGGYGTTNSSFIGDIYYVKIYGNGNLERWFIPCVRIDDGKVGFYDIVGKSFYVNAKTGDDLIAGP